MVNKNPAVNQCQSIFSVLQLNVRNIITFRLATVARMPTVPTWARFANKSSVVK